MVGLQRSLDSLCKFHKHNPRYRIAELTTCVRVCCQERARLLYSCVGLLFLSGGRATLGRSNKAIAALLCALFPVYPIETLDCRYHLQAFRHLYVLAVKHRCLELYDADTHDPIVAPVYITITQPTPTGASAASCTLERTSPCLLPPRDVIERLEVRSPRYWPLQLDRALLDSAHPDGNAKVLSCLHIIPFNT